MTRKAAAGHCHWSGISISTVLQSFSDGWHHHVQARRVHQLRRRQRPQQVALEQQLLLQFVQRFPHPVVPTETVCFLDRYLNTYTNSCARTE
uniref:Uncharacterized protein n=1 Tax=Arundo donax TaxID=35708 RepID=A0A0A9GXA2_ARUDO